MKKIVQVFVFFVMLLATVAVIARPVSVDKAHRIARIFLQGVGCEHYATLVDHSIEMPFHQFYLFTAEEGGFVLVAADDCVTPIVAYSATNRFDVKNIPAHVMDWLGGYEEQIAYYVSQDVSHGNGRQQNDGVSQQWSLLLQGRMPVTTVGSSVSSLLSTTWSQSPYYNELCPEDDGHYSGHAVAGCTAIATAQVMKYWNHPATGYGSMTYYHDDYGYLDADFGSTTYQWNDMPNSLSGGSSSTEVNAVATLVYHVGVAVNMNYGANGSGAATIAYGNLSRPSAENALKHNFKYKSSLRAVHRCDYAPEVFDSILCVELDNSRPIIFSGYDYDAGHAFVLDGYDGYGNFHVNWGWGGYCDGYYAIGALNPSPGGTGGNTSGTYNIDNSAIIGVEPNYDFSTTATTSVTAVSSNPLYGTTTGTGNYAFGDTVLVQASAAEGCRFVQWDDGYRYNPRGFLAMGDDYSYTAIFEPLAGDTLSYVSANNMLTCIGIGTTGADVYWGVRFPASVLTPRHNLKEVQLYVAYAGVYSAYIYVGDVYSSAPVASQTFVVPDSVENSWVTVAFATPVTISGTQDVYIAFYNNDVEYPAALSYDCGNDDALLWGSSLYSMRGEGWNYSYMIRGIFESPILADSTLSYSITCMGTGAGTVERVDVPSSNLCGTVQQVTGGVVPRYKFLPAQGSVLTHLYVNGVDRINEVESDSSNSLLWCYIPLDTATVYPVFDLRSYVVTASSSNVAQGTVTGSDEYAYGSNAVLTASPNEGYHFSYWVVVSTSGNDTSYQNPYETTVMGDLSATAFFAPNSYHIEIVANDSSYGEVTGSGEYDYLTEVTATAIPYSGYRFVGWSNGNTLNPYVFQVTKNDTLVALFQLDEDTTTYRISVSVNDSAMGAVTGGGVFRQGDPVVLEAIPFDGYRFDNWSDGSTENPYHVTVTEDAVYVAYFSRVTGIDETQSVRVMLYPNPTTDVVHVEADGVRNILVYDQVGRMVKTFTATETVDLSALMPGIYTLCVQLSQGDTIRKVVKVDF